MNLFLTRLLKPLVLFLLLLVVSIALLPTIISTSWGQKQLIKWINHSIPGHVDIHRLELNWGKGQLIEGFVFSDSDGTPILEFNRFSTEGTLFQLIKKNPRLGFTQFENLNLTLFNDQKGQTNFEKALGISSPHHMPSFIPSKILLSDVYLEGYLFSDNHPLSFKMNGLTQQDDLKGSIDINLSLNELKISNWQSLKESAQSFFTVEGSKEARFQLDIVNFPVELIDRLASLHNPELGGFIHSLFGDYLNINMDNEPNPDGLLLNLTLSTPLLQGHLEGIVKDETISLRKAARFNLKVNPESINSFSYPYFEVLNSSNIELILSDLTIPLNFFGKTVKNPDCLLGFNGNFSIPETDINLPSIGKIKLRQFNSHLSSKLCDKAIEVELNGQGIYGKESIDLALLLTMDKPNHFLDSIGQIRKTFKSHLSISNFPLRLIPFINQHPDLDDKIGSQVDIKVEIKPENNDEWLATCSIETPKISLKEAQFIVGDEIRLISKSQLNWILSEDTLANVFNQDLFKIEKPATLNLVFKHFKIPLAQPKQISFELESSISGLRFPKLINQEIAEVDDLILKVDGKNPQEINSNLALKLSLLDQQGQPSPLVPDPLIFKQNSNWRINEDGLIEMTAGNVEISNSVTQIQGEARIDRDNLFEITHPIEIKYNLSPKAFAHLSRVLNKNWPNLQDSTLIDLNIQPSEFDLKSFSISNLYLQGVLKLKKVVFGNTHMTDLPVLEDFFISWVLDSSKGNFYTNVKGVTYTDQDPKPSQVSAHIQFWIQNGFYDFDHLESEIRINLSGLPTSTLNIAFGLPDLSPVVGSILDFDVKLYYDPTHKKSGYLDFVLDSTHFHSEGRFKLNERMELSTLDKRPILRITVTPDSYKAIKNLIEIKDERQLAAPFTTTATLSHIDFPLNKYWIQNGAFDFTLKSSNIEWTDSSLPYWKLESHLSTKDLKDHLYFSTLVKSKTSLKIEGALKNLFDKANKLQSLSEIGLKIDMNGQQLTPFFLYSFLPLNLDQQLKIKALFGETFDMNLSAQLEKLKGSLQVSVKGVEGQIQMDGLIKNGVLTLNKPLEASLQVTPLFIQTFLTPNVPLLSTAVGAETPLRFSIDPSEFSCPLIPFKLDEIKILKGNLNLGKINFKNEGELQSVLSIIGPTTGKFFTIWFTPIYFELNRGILSLKRFDMLVAKSYSLANWGSVNLMTHQADFVLGLPAQTLHYAFNIQGLDDKYILQVPLHTAKGKVEVDKKKVTARITSLIAQTHGGDKGKLLGGILDLVLSEKGEIYPNPTTHPFPWEEEFNSPTKQKSIANEIDSPPPSEMKEKADSKKSKKKNKTIYQGDLKNLQEGAVQLLDQWLK